MSVFTSLQRDDEIKNNHPFTNYAAVFIVSHVYGEEFFSFSLPEGGDVHPSSGGAAAKRPAS